MDTRIVRFATAEAVSIHHRECGTHQHTDFEQGASISGRDARILRVMSEPRKHQGSCHCGSVRYEVSLDLEQPVISCNCSMCGRSGTLLAFAPEAAFTLLSGEEALRDYQFNKHVIHHLFCTRCGIKPFARGKMKDGTPMAAINVRCLEGVDLDELTIEKYDGKLA